LALATIADVAAHAGVSKSTASRALRGAGTVSAATRRRVQHAADQLAFVATPSAARLATGRTHTVAVVTPFVCRWFFATAVAGIQHELARSGFDLLLYDLHQPAARERFFTEMPVRGRADGAVLLTLPVSEAEETALAGLRLPMAFVGDIVPGSSSVRIDDRGAARLATRHLLNLGHQRLAFIGGDPSEPMGFAAPAQRRAGFDDAIREAGVVVPEAHVAAGDFTAAGGAVAMSQILAAERIPTAVFVASDEMAFGAVHTIRQLGLRVPQDISVIGFDDHELAEPFGLTTVRQDVYRQAHAAARSVLDTIAAGESASPRHRVVSTELVVRDTTARAGEPPSAHRTIPPHERNTA